MFIFQIKLYYINKLVLFFALCLFPSSTTRDPRSPSLHLTPSAHLILLPVRSPQRSERVFTCFLIGCCLDLFARPAVDPLPGTFGLCTCLLSLGLQGDYYLDICA